MTDGVVRASNRASRAAKRPRRPRALAAPARPGRSRPSERSPPRDARPIGRTRPTRTKSLRESRASRRRTQRTAWARTARAGRAARRPPTPSRHTDPRHRRAGPRLAPGTRGDAAPKDPSTEGIVQRDSVVEDRRAAPAAAADAAQEHALRGRIGGTAVGTAEEAESGDLPNRLVQGGSGARCDLRRRENRDARRRVRQTHFGARRGDRDGLGEGGGQERDCQLEIRGAGRNRLPRGDEPLRFHGELERRGRLAGEAEASVRSRPRARSCAAARDRDPRVGDGIAAREDHPRDRSPPILRLRRARQEEQGEPKRPAASSRPASRPSSRPGPMPRPPVYRRLLR